MAQGSGGEDPAAPPIACPLFPDDNYWHADVSRLPVLPKSDTYIGSIGRDTPLKADFDTSGYPEELRVILRAMQEHGLILADNGSSMFVSGAPDDRWDNDMLAFPGEIEADDFEAVDVSSLIVDPDSGQVRK